MLGLLLGGGFDLIGRYMAISKEWKVKTAWFNLGMSIAASSHISFVGMFGLTTGGLLLKGTDPWVALVGGIATGAVSSATSLIWLWKTSELTKGIALAYPMKLEEETQRMLHEQGFVVTKRK